VPPLSAVDVALERWALRTRHRPLATPAYLLSAAADRSKLWVGLAAVRTLTEPRRDWRPAARVVAVVALQSALVHFAVKPLFRRRRPAVEVAARFGMRRPPSGSFPSGHAATAAAAAVLLADGRRGWGAPLGALALGVGWSRVQVGLHHLSDVAGGLALGAAVGLAARRLLPLPPNR
jgi:membrane-associated phospholipid phosphatase